MSTPPFHGNLWTRCRVLRDHQSQFKLIAGDLGAEVPEEAV